jgi:hypothetical protein
MILIKTFAGAESFVGPEVLCVLERIIVFGAPGSCPGFLGQAPGPLPAGAVSTWLRLLCQGPGRVPAAKFTVDHKL